MLAHLSKDPSHVLKRNRILVSKTNTVASKSDVNYPMPAPTKTIKSQIRGIQPHVIPHGIRKVPPASYLVQNAISRAGSSFEDKGCMKTMSNPSMEHMSSFRNQGIMSQAVQHQRAQNLISLDHLMPSVTQNQRDSPSALSGINIKIMGKKSPTYI